MNTIVNAQNLTKVYKLYDRPSGRLKELFFKKPLHREFVALQGISFELAPGDTLGIIGENGAGKSTLLKILARTLSPTGGTLDIRGKVSSLLELGSGFHPEFTGRENVYFYGALLGLTKEDLSKRMDTILEFAEIGDFINYPLKTYSSGMYVRLAFAVATAIDPDILVVDEALSVGDLYFQKKSIDKILSFKDQGKTIIFCSHAMYYINQLCEKVIWLKNGRVEMFGDQFGVTQAYEQYQLEKRADRKEEEAAAAGDSGPKPVVIEQVQIKPFPEMKTGEDLRVTMKVLSPDHACLFNVAAVLKRADGLDIASTYTKEQAPLTGDNLVSLAFPSLQLRGGTYFLRTYALDEHMLHIFDVKDSPSFTIPKRSIEVGLVELPCTWTAEPYRR